LKVNKHNVSISICGSVCHISAASNRCITSRDEFSIIFAQFSEVLQFEEDLDAIETDEANSTDEAHSTKEAVELAREFIRDSREADQNLDVLLVRTMLVQKLEELLEKPEFNSLPFSSTQLRKKDEEDNKELRKALQNLRDNLSITRAGPSFVASHVQTMISLLEPAQPVLLLTPVYSRAYSTDPEDPEPVAAPDSCKWPPKRAGIRHNFDRHFHSCIGITTNSILNCCI
jgi:hypothetical protein